jgi:hypothetical protein
MGKKFLQNAHHDRTENRKNASGTAMERGGSLESPRQVDATRQRSATRCFTIVANKIDGGGRIRQQRQKSGSSAQARRCIAAYIITMSSRTTADHGLAAWVGSCKSC